VLLVKFDLCSTATLLGSPARPPLKGSTGALVTNFRPVARRVSVFFPHCYPKATCATLSPARAGGESRARILYPGPPSAPPLPRAPVVAPLEEATSHPNVTASVTTAARISRECAVQFVADMEASGGPTIPANKVECV